MPELVTHNTPCEMLKLTATTQDQMFAMLEDIQRTNAKQSKILEEQKDMFKAWNDTKGFISTMKSLGALLIWITVTVGALVIIIHATRDYLLNK